MASTNKTTNVLLSQFLGTDHFSFLTDYNGDMLKIDTYCGNLKSLLDGTNGAIESISINMEGVQSDIQSIQTVQENQNTNITANTEDITVLKKDNLENKGKIDKNTEDIEKLKQSSGSIINLEVTKTTSSGMQAFTPTLKFNTQKNEFYLAGNTTYTPTSVLNGISYVGTINVSDLPTKIKSIITRTTFTSSIGYVKYLFNQTIDGVNYIHPIVVPLFVDIYSEDGTLQAIKLALSPKTTLPNIDGEVISSASYLVNGVISLSDQVV